MGTFHALDPAIEPLPTTQTEADLLSDLAASALERFDLYRDHTIAGPSLDRLTAAAREKLDRERASLREAVKHELRRHDLPDWAMPMVAEREARSAAVVTIEKFLAYLARCTASGSALRYDAD